MQAQNASNAKANPGKGAAHPRGRDLDRSPWVAHTSFFKYAPKRSKTVATTYNTNVVATHGGQRSTPASTCCWPRVRRGDTRRLFGAIVRRIGWMSMPAGSASRRLGRISATRVAGRWRSAAGMGSKTGQFGSFGSRNRQNGTSGASGSTRKRESDFPLRSEGVGCRLCLTRQPEFAKLGE
jgi:hypothetical protein